MYEFEQNKKNNLILYGIVTKHPETSESLKARVVTLFKDHLNIRREITVVRAARIHTGEWSTHPKCTWSNVLVIPKLKEALI